MVQLYPAQALEQLEFDKIVVLLEKNCRSDEAKYKARHLRIHTKLGNLKRELTQTLEFKSSIASSDPFPLQFTRNIKKELKLLSIDRAVLLGIDLIALKELTLNIRDIHLWFKRQGDIFPELALLMEAVPYIKEIQVIIQPVVDDNGVVRDNASPELLQIRNELHASRQRQRKVFEGVVRKLAKQGYLADITESFLNGRRVVAVGAEHKRIVKGIFHGESDSARTAFIEPEETIALNNEVDAWEREEKREIQKVLAQTTALLMPYHAILTQYYSVVNNFEFIRAKAILAIEMGANLPVLLPSPSLKLIDAYHPLLYLYNQAQQKETVPLNLTLDKKERILIISGPNAGGKTVAMKTVGLLQVMLQAGLLVPVNPISEMGLFKQIMIHIGDTQSIENELSTYSAHLKDMKYFLENAHGKTLFFIDELGGGTDPNLGGAFAEAIVERLSYKNAIGIITTHYLNLKVMAGKVKGIVNGAMNFDEEKLEPLYKLTIGKPGSSYTFAIAQRTGLPSEIINRAKQLTDRGHFKLDKMLHQAERQTVRLDDKESMLNKLIQEYEEKKASYDELIDKERLKQHFATLKLQNKIKKDELDYLRDTERKFKQLMIEWKKTTNKQEVIKSAEQLLFKRKQLKEQEVAAQKADRMYIVTGKQPKVGDLVRNIHNHQVGQLEELLANHKAKVKINKLSFQVNLNEWIVVERNKKVN